MNRRILRPSRAFVCRVLVLLLAAPGCSSKPKVVDRGDAAGLRRVAAAYHAAAVRTGRPPRTPADLAPFLPAGEDVDALLASARDGRPYVIFWGVDPRPGKAGPSPVVVGYERTATAAARFVFLDMGVVLMTDQEFAKAAFPNGHMPE